MTEAQEMMRWEVTAFGLAEVLEYAPLVEERPVRYDFEGWVGGARDRVWFKADGEQSTVAGVGESQLQLVYGRLVAPFWDLQVGVLLDARYGRGVPLARPALSLGVEGLAPGWFELEPTVFVSIEGDVSARLTASYDLLLSQRLIVQPRMELGAAVQSVPELGVGSGVTDLELALRLRYEIWRELAPYVGVLWEHEFGETARFSRASGEQEQEFTAVAGLRVWY